MTRIKTKSSTKTVDTVPYAVERRYVIYERTLPPGHDQPILGWTTGDTKDDALTNAKKMYPNAAFLIRKVLLQEHEWQDAVRKQAAYDEEHRNEEIYE